MSEIYFTDPKQLKAVIDQTMINQDGEKDSPHRCLLIEQVSEQCTRFTSYQPRRLKHSRLLYHGEFGGGRPGAQFLVNHENLQREVNSICNTYNALTFKAVSGNLVIYGDESYTEDGEHTCEGTTYCHRYPGVESDFAPPQELSETDLKGKLERQAFKEWLNLIARFGGTETNNSKDSFYFLLHPKDRLLGITNAGENSSGYIFSLQVAETLVEEQVVTSLLRKDVPRIRGVYGEEAEEIWIYHQEGWTQFQGSQGTVLLHDAETNPMIRYAKDILEIKEGADNDLKDKTGALQKVGSKTFSAYELKKKL
ncbi:MAG: hypothetical protein ABEK59_07520 [Halobacteria archaeon]